jgi:hypothetical protein
LCSIASILKVATNETYDLRTSSTGIVYLGRFGTGLPLPAHRLLLRKNHDPAIKDQRFFLKCGDIFHHGDKPVHAANLTGCLVVELLRCVATRTL